VSCSLPAILADYSFGHALLTVCAFFLLVIWVWLLITVIMDLFRDHEISGAAKAAWVFFLVFLPVITLLVYLIARGGGMRDRAIAQQREIQQATDQYIRNAASSPADELSKLTDLRDKGVLSAEEFDRLKAKVVA
jgi:ABC-type multidrug transport system fused ATPase/permease subunit